MSRVIRPTAVYLIGARGAIATSVAHGIAGLSAGALPPIGIATAMPPLEGALGCAPFESFVLGGCDVRAGALATEELRAAGILSTELVASAEAAVAEYAARLEGGLLDTPEGTESARGALERGAGGGELHPETAELAGLPPRARVERLIERLNAFRGSCAAEHLVVVNLASVEAQVPDHAALESLAAFEAALDAGVELPASTLYAYATFKAGGAFANFTPSPGAEPAALRELAEQAGVPHSGNDGKTGETLVKTALAPMFAHRALNVMSWVGYNMLGNRDGAVLNDPEHKQAKLDNKDAVLRSILPDPALFSHVGIDYVPSLGDWKTALDFVHFEGFLGAKMSLQFNWVGSDSALAAPLVIDLVRLCELALRRGESGVMRHTANYFKSPMDGGTHDFHEQIQLLHDYAAGVARNREA